MKTRGWILIVAGGAIAIGLIGFGLTQLANSRAERQAAEETATPLPQRVEVVALGRLEPEGEVIRISGPTGERLSQLFVKRGDAVNGGQELALLESFQERKAERDLAASQLIEAVKRLRAETAVERAEIQSAQTNIQQIEEPTTFEIEAQKATIRERQAQLELAKIDLKRFQDLFREGAIAEQTLDRQWTEVRELREQLNNAKATLIRLQKSRTTDLLNAQAQLQAARANLPLSQIRVAVESAQQNLKLADARLARTIIRAPRPGRVLQVLTYAGEAIGNDGILDLGDTRQMYVVAEVYETDVGLVKVGQTATVTSRNGAFEGNLAGTVSEVGWEIFKNDVLDDDPAADADARVVEVRVRLEESERVDRLTNLQVDVRIDVQ